MVGSYSQPPLLIGEAISQRASKGSIIPAYLTCKQLSIMPESGKLSAKKLGEMRSKSGEEVGSRQSGGFRRARCYNRGPPDRRRGGRSNGMGVFQIQFPPLP